MLRALAVGVAASGASTVAGLMLVGVSPAGIPYRALAAYVTVAATDDTAAPGCSVDWRDLAGVGWAESGHGTSGFDGVRDRHVDPASGLVVPPITKFDVVDWGGGFTGFLAGTWARYGEGGDPNQVDDAVAATRRKLCADNYPTDRHAALRSYNGSGPAAEAYATKVEGYADGLPADPAELGMTGEVAQAAFRNVRYGKTAAVDGVPVAAAPSLPKLGDLVDRAYRKVLEVWAAAGRGLHRPGTAREAGLWDEANRWVANAAGAGGDGPTPPKAKPSSLPAASPEVVPGGAGLDVSFQQRLGRAFAAAPGTVTVVQGYRTPTEQLSKWRDALERYGSESEANRWVARAAQNPDGSIECGSNHCKGRAADLDYGDGETAAWMHDHAAEFGLHYPLSNEPWHIEPTETGGQRA